MIGTRRIYDEWTAESDPAHQKYIGLILRLSCGAAIPPKQRKWPKCSQSGADLQKSEQMGVSRTYTTTKGMYSSSIYTSGIYNGDIQKQFRTTKVKRDELEWKPRLQLIELLLLMRDIAVVA